MFFHIGTIFFFCFSIIIIIISSLLFRVHLFVAVLFRICAHIFMVCCNGGAWCYERNHAHIINDASTTRIVIITTIYLFGIQKILIFNISFLFASANRRHQPGKIVEKRVCHSSRTRRKKSERRVGQREREHFAKATPNKKQWHHLSSTSIK